jgi:hypothetical protein
MLTLHRSCSCQGLHQANLLLQHHTALTATFRVVLWFEAYITEMRVFQSPWVCQDTSIKLLEDCPVSLAPSIHTSLMEFTR